MGAALEKYRAGVKASDTPFLPAVQGFSFGI